MTVYRCADGGFHEGKDCYDEFRSLMTHTSQIRDIPLVRLPSREQLAEKLRESFSQQFLDEDLDAVLWAMVELTPSTKAEWSKTFKEQR